VVLALTWLNKRALQDTSEPITNTETAAPAATEPPPLTAPTPQGPVVLTAKEPTWIQVYEKGGQTFFSGTLNAGQNFTVPPNAAAPLLKTGKPEGLTITVGSAVAPEVGPAAKMVSDVSLLGPDLMKGGATSAAEASTTAAQSPPSRPTRSPRRASAPAPAAAPTTADAAPANTAGE